MRSTAARSEPKGSGAWAPAEFAAERMLGRSL
jgi:hypothetical protein